MKYLIIFSLLLILSCCKTTYTKSKCVSYWIDKYNDKIQVFEIKTFDRKTKKLLSTKLDTIKHEKFNNTELDNWNNTLFK